MTPQTCDTPEDYELEIKELKAEITRLKAKLKIATADVWHYENECQIIGDDDTMKYLEKKREEELKKYAPTSKNDNL